MPDSLYELGSNKHVFIDWELVEAGYGLTHEPSRGGPEKPTCWEMPTGVRLTVHEPTIDRRPLIQCDKPWETLIVSYATLMQVEGEYRLYYECKYKAHLESRLSDSGSMQAVATSTDCVNWTKPSIGAVPFQGSTDNNLIFLREMTLGRDCHGATVFVDPHAPASERFKMVHMGWDYKAMWDLCGAVSEDGFHWRALEKELVHDHICDSQNVATYDAERGKYVAYVRGWKHSRRMIARTESDTFDSFPKPQVFDVTEPTDTPDADVYTNAYTRWPGTSRAHLMLPAFFMRSADTAEVHLLTSRDGIQWHRPQREPIIAAEEPGSGMEGGAYAGCGVVETPAGDWVVPVSPTRYGHNQQPFPGGRPPDDELDLGHICLARWRKDGFMSLEAPTQGSWTTVPMSFAGAQLRVNAYTPYGGEILVELAREDGEPIPGFTFEDCDSISGDVPDHVVTWQGRSDVSALAGESLRMRWRMRRAHLHSLQFTH